MKIIHCSDLHLDSKMETNLNKEKAKERKNEILLTFEKMVDFAKKNGVKVIIIAGDMFDKKNISVKAKKIVKNQIILNPEIDFLYLKGNHDEINFIEEEEEIPSNLKLFNEKEWVTYKYGDIAVTGIEIGKQNNYNIYNSLILEKNDINIVVMHGQESQNDVKDKTEIINLKELKNKNIDYLALGHIHTFKQEKLDNRGIYCYSGCLEGRGFDECGEKGFVLLDIEDKQIKTQFIPIAKRTLHEINIDITGVTENYDIEQKIEEETNKISKDDLIKIVLKGKVEAGTTRDIDYLKKKYEDRFYCIKIYDETTLNIDYMKHQNDASLKGEFIRLVLEQDLTDEEKGKIINTGIRALLGEEV